MENWRAGEREGMREARKGERRWMKGGREREGVRGWRERGSDKIERERGIREGGREECECISESITILI